MIPLWYQRWRRRRYCFHHDHRTGESWILPGIIIDYRKLYRCSTRLGGCDKVWIR
jgi:hypothetical protein